MRAREKLTGSTCGCFVAMGRDPFEPGLVGHWLEAHADALPLLVASQVRALEGETYAVAGFPKSRERWLASSSTSVQLDTSAAVFESMPTGGVCPTCRAGP